MLPMRTSMHTQLFSLSLSILSPSPHETFSLSFSHDVHVMHLVHKKVCSPMHTCQCLKEKAGYLANLSARLAFYFEMHLIHPADY